MPKTRSSRGAVELPLTYLYAVLIGIVVFIIAARVIGVQSQNVAAQNQQLVLTYFDSLIEHFGENPNTIENLTIPNLQARLSWDQGSRVSVGSSSAPIRFDTFSEPTLEGRIIGWSYPFAVETPSSPLLMLSDGTIEYRIVNDAGTDGIASALIGQAPIGREAYGLELVRAQTPRTTNAPVGVTAQRALCIVSNPPQNPSNGCDLVWYSTKAPYGYLTWTGKRWYPTYSYGMVFAALFAANEQAWNSTIVHAESRDLIERSILASRAENLSAWYDAHGAKQACQDAYATSVGNLTAMNETIASLRATGSTPQAQALSTWSTRISSGVRNLTTTDRTLTQLGCPGVIG